MEVLGIRIDRPSIFPTTIVMEIVFLMKQVFECLRVTEDVDLGLKRPDNFPLATVEFIIMVIKVAKMEDVDICIKIPANITLTIMDQEVMLTGEVDIVLI